VKIIPYEPWHMIRMKIQPKQRSAYMAAAEDHAAAGEAITGVIGSKVIFCAGRSLIWEGRYMLWAVLSQDACKHMLCVTREIKSFLQLCRGRLEVVVDSKFEEAHRWARILGFKLHHHEEMFLPDGGDADIYVRFQ
jgi:hypothetical protein